ncbi:MAG: hypothetical protein H6999_02445 [Hahellaceae bacterium]|nr:hypothetical protein [Hahellaceae bacterium]MCP5168602.1 hypothetical protein [Hahellaceae bacterium]
MSREKLLNTKIKTENAGRLQQLLLDYNTFRFRKDVPCAQNKQQLLDWQTERLKQSHHDLYTHPRYHEGLDFLLKDLYAPKEFIQRDNDFERVFPVMVKLLPDNLLYTVSLLIELNLLTQQLDEALTLMLFEQMNVDCITFENYAEAYRRCNNEHTRLHQIQLIANIGNDLDVYVRSRMVSFSLKITRSPAEMAGLGSLHDFLTRGFHAFHTMGGVDELLDRIVARETHILKQIYSNDATPFSLNTLSESALPNHDIIPHS